MKDIYSEEQIMIPGSVESIPPDEVGSVVSGMLRGCYDTDTVERILTGLVPENMTTAQLAACVDGIVSTAEYQINTDEFDMPIIVPVGTGGDMQSTVNITTMAGMVMAASGECGVALYGNKSSSGKFGKMDLLESVGIPIVLDEEEISEGIRRNGIAPVYARAAYPGARHVAEARSRIPRSTLFNIAFPISAPVVGRDVRMLVGSAKDETLRSMADISAARGVGRGVFVRDAEYGLDEVSLSNTHIVVVGSQGVEEHQMHVGRALDEEMVGIEMLQACDPKEFVEVFERVIDPQYDDARTEAVRKVVAANAACGLYLANDHVNGFKDYLPAYYRQARRLLQNGDVYNKVCELIKYEN